MKKIFKGCMTVVLIGLALGLVMLVLTDPEESMNRVREIVSSVTDRNGNNAQENGTGWEEPEALFDINDSSMFHAEYDIYEHDVEKFSVGSKVTGLNIKVGGCTFCMEASDDSEFYVEATGAGSFQCFSEAGTLYIKSSKTTVNSLEEWEKGMITLYVPTESLLEQVDAGLSAGLMKIANIVTKEMRLEAGAGQITVEQLQAEHCQVKVGMGEVLVKDMQVKKMDADVDMGHLRMDGAALGDVNAKCSVGSMELNLTGDEKDYNYTLASAMGQVTINGTDYSGLAQEKTVQNSAKKNVNIECTMGKIEVNLIH